MAQSVTVMQNRPLWTVLMNSSLVILVQWTIHTKSHTEPRAHNKAKLHDGAIHRHQCEVEVSNTNNMLQLALAQDLTGSAGDFPASLPVFSAILCSKALSHLLL